MYRCLHGTAPNTQWTCTNHRHCWSSASAVCQSAEVDRWRYRLNSFSRRCFAVVGPSTWNSLRDPALSLSMFRRLLKTFFAKYWRDVLRALRCSALCSNLLEEPGLSGAIQNARFNLISFNWLLTVTVRKVSELDTMSWLSLVSHFPGLPGFGNFSICSYPMRHFATCQNFYHTLFRLELQLQLLTFTGISCLTLTGGGRYCCTGSHWEDDGSASRSPEQATRI